MAARTWRSILCLSVTLSVAAGCSPTPAAPDAGAEPASGPEASAPGADLSCAPGETYCADEATVLFCSREATLATAPCRGSEGCTVGASGVVCDDSTAVPGDACATEGHAACSSDKLLVLTCNAFHRFESLQRCDGPAACSASGGLARCDDSVAAVADRCARAGEISCTRDGKSALVCKDGSFSPAAACGGPDHCQVEGVSVFCDRRVGGRDEPCDHEGQLACSASGTALLRCEQGKLAPYNSCDGPGGCSVKAAPAKDRTKQSAADAAKDTGAARTEGIVCDDSVAVAEEPCAKEGEPACSVDGRAYLLCTDHRFVRGGECLHGGCRYDPGEDAFRCDQKVVAGWPQADAIAFAGRWVEHSRGDRGCNRRLLIDVWPEGWPRVTLLGCTHKPVDIEQSTSPPGHLQFMVRSGGFLYRLKLDGAELAEDVERGERPEYFFTRE